MIIDGHLHLFRPASVTRRLVDDLAPADRDAPVEELIEVQARHGVDAGVVVPLGAEDDYLREVLTRYPTRFAGVAVCPTALGNTRPGRELVESLKARHSRAGFHGIRVRWLGDPNRSLTDSPMYEVLRWAADEGLALWVYVPADQLTLLGELARTLPTLPLVLNHLGFCPGLMAVDAHRRPRFDEPVPPATLPRVLALAAHRQVHVMLSGLYAFSRRPAPYGDLAQLVRQLVDAFGADRTLWASDWPWIRDEPGYGAVVSLPAQLLTDASSTELADIQGGTAARLFPHLNPTHVRSTDAQAG